MREEGRAAGGVSDAQRRIALTGDVALELLAPYFREAGWQVFVPAGFAAWRQQLLDPDSPLRRFAPDLVFDVTAHDAALARDVPGFFDERFRAVASMPYSLAGIRAIVDEAEFAAVASPRKILAVDADNTLWRGILSEDGRAALVPYEEFQRGLLELKRDGVVLVLLTKNDPSDDFMRGDMPLCDGDFAVRKINWRPKSLNLAEACRELNLSTDSVVFVDDNPHERAQMASHLPEVAVAPFPADMAHPAQFLRRLREYFFSGMGKTEEDRLRAASYEARRRAGDLGAASSTDDYLAALGLRAVPALATAADVPRLAQMAGKTNQFNATTIRRTEDDFRALLADPARKIFVFRASDRFGDQGLVCYIVVNLPARRITDFVMSCRAMGRTLEHFAFRYVCDALGFVPEVDFVPTPKNSPFGEFLGSNMLGKSFYCFLASAFSLASCFSACLRS